MQDPESLAHAFVGAFSHYVFCETVFGYRPASPGVYIRAVVDTVVRATELGGNPEVRPRARLERRGRRKLIHARHT